MEIPRAFQANGYKPPIVTDSRNFILEKAQAVLPFPVSYKTDLTQLGIYDQEQIPDCVENALTLVKRYHLLKTQGQLIDLSRRFLACLTVKDDGFPISEGTSVEKALNRLKNTGICESSLFPDDHTLSESTFSNVSLIPQDAFDNAAKYKIQSYAFLSDRSANGLKNAIYQNGVVVIGAKIDQNWWTNPQGQVSWKETDILPIRPPSGKFQITGHCIVLYAYDEKYFYFWNSFGKEWGYQGHGWFAINELPFIYEAATLVDLTAEQIAQLKSLQQTQLQVQQSTDPNKNVISRILDFIIEMLFGEVHN